MQSNVALENDVCPHLLACVPTSLLCGILRPSLTLRVVTGVADYSPPAIQRGMSSQPSANFFGDCSAAISS